MASCVVCLGPAEAVCAACEIDAYCGVDCQERNWQEHSELCVGALLDRTRGFLDVVNSRSDLSTLAAAIKRAGLEETISRLRRVTLFAPNNAAFENMIPLRLSSTLADPAALRKLLLSHIVYGKYKSKDLIARALVLKTLSEESLSYEIEGGRVVFPSYANALRRSTSVVSGDVNTKNGVVHIVDQVVLFE